MSADKITPVPQGKYVSATRVQGLIFTAGMTPRESGVLLMHGKVRAEQPLEIYREAVYQATSNALAAAEHMLEKGERIGQVLQLCVYVNAGDGFTAHSRIADFASEYLYQALKQSGVAARAALGVSSLPGDAPVELQMICSVEMGSA